ncbi:hypothetical protein EGI88_04975 [Empedobacter falsenii]|uniref:Uncharacterized protein n=1 Tax=Empedobacter falsenii TaxID=343874 RepID=A0A427BQP3_9FLAO|nr:hypothetical protein EGI89_04725 [Empedobacter falsenii]RRT93054.1 hypothetical protein EGI88_04975 [Empedobacter falsenii]
MEYDTIEYIRIHKSKFLNENKSAIKNYDNLPAKFSLYKYKNPENKNSYKFQNEYKISEKLKDNWYLLERIE